MTLNEQQEITIPVGEIRLKGDLIVPPEANAIIIFSHGSGSSRKSARNRMVAERLNQHHFGTLLFDLLTEEEDKNYTNRFNINLLTARLIAVTQWLQTHFEERQYAIGYFGASTGAASALRAAAALPAIGAVVSRGGRPDLADKILPRVTAPVLLIAGSLDQDILGLNRYAYQHLAGEKRLKIITGATHLFEEPGTLEQAADAAVAWFEKYLLPEEHKIYSHVHKPD